MKVDRTEKRLKGIKSSFVLFETKCEACEELYKREKMWKVCIWGTDRRGHILYFCRNCMKTKEDVLKKIDSSYIGIFGVDDFCPN